jgi:hypothetical protein
MAADCGANKEALMLPIVSAFEPLLQKSAGGVAGLPQRRRGLLVLVFERYFRAAGGPDGSLK